MDVKEIILMIGIVLFFAIPFIQPALNSVREFKDPKNGKKNIVSTIAASALAIFLVFLCVNFFNKDDKKDNNQFTTELPSFYFSETTYVSSESGEEKPENRTINGNGFKLIVPDGWHSNDTKGMSDYELSYSVSRRSSQKMSHNSNNVINMSISSSDMETTDEELSYLFYSLLAESTIDSIKEMIDEDDKLSLSEVNTYENCTFNDYSACSIKFGCYNDIDTVDLTTARYSTDENGITIIENFEYLPTVTHYDVPCWTTFYYLYSQNWFISVEIVVPKETEEDMLQIADELISLFTLTE